MKATSQKIKSFKNFTNKELSKNQFFCKEIKDYKTGGFLCEFCKNQCLPWSLNHTDSDKVIKILNILFFYFYYIIFHKKHYCCSDYKDFIRSILDYNDYSEALNHKLYTDFRLFNSTNNKKNSKLLNKKIEELK